MAEFKRPLWEVRDNGTFYLEYRFHRQLYEKISVVGATPRNVRNLETGATFFLSPASRVYVRIEEMTRECRDGCNITMGLA